jgi:hypothetical protein
MNPVFFFKDHGMMGDKSFFVSGGNREARPREESRLNK